MTDAQKARCREISEHASTVPVGITWLVDCPYCEGLGCSFCGDPGRKVAGRGEFRE